MTVHKRNPRSLPTVPIDDISAWHLPAQAQMPHFCANQVSVSIESTTHLPPLHYAVLCALLKSAHGGPRGDAYPSGVLFDAPEQSRTRLTEGDTYNFGLHLITQSLEEGERKLRSLLNGIERVGTSKKSSHGLKGNFRVAKVQPLEVCQTDSGVLVPIPVEHFQREIHAVSKLREVTLRFDTPLRCERPRNLRRPNHDCMDPLMFLPDVVFRRAARRLKELGFLQAIPDIAPRHIECLENRLVWMEMRYGTKQVQLSGSIGKVVLKLNHPGLAIILVLAQYLRVGEKTRFGFGSYRIQELEESPHRATRATSLQQVALTPMRIETVAEVEDVDPAHLRFLGEEVLQNRYVVRPPKKYLFGPQTSNSEPRLLTIPHPDDQLLQRCVLNELAPVFDQLFEESSFAYRKGLGRQHAAKSLQRAYRDGYRWAVRSDFHNFFDSIDHRVLQDRLEAYLGDQQMVQLLMSWVRSGSIQPGRGIPTGAVLSPLLANLFLDRFDEEISSLGARLVRYADDFLILFRNPESAQEIFESAQEYALNLKLHLNQEKTRFVDLTEPFEFLGFHFFRQQGWQVKDGQPPQHIDELGWVDAPRSSPQPPKQVVLPGESRESSSRSSAVTIAGPDVKRVSVQKKKLVIEFSDDRSSVKTSLRNVTDLIVLGYPDIDSTIFSDHEEIMPQLWVADHSGRLRSQVIHEQYPDNALLVQAQVAAAQDADRSLGIARQIIAAKIANYAALARLAPSRSSRPCVSRKLIDLLNKISMTESIEELLGLEGAAAAAWYQSIGPRLHRKFDFPGRVAPLAEDPVNVLLNIGFTWLYRTTQLVISREGLIPSIGFLHAVRPGHAALASDLMEPLRHIIERCVITATYVLKPGDFQESQGPFKLNIKPEAAKQFVVLLQQTLAQPAAGWSQSESRPYRQQLATMLRSLHRHLLKPEVAFQVFRHEDKPLRG